VIKRGGARAGCWRPFPWPSAARLLAPGKSRPLSQRRPHTGYKVQAPRHGLNGAPSTPQGNARSRWRSGGVGTAGWGPLALGPLHTLSALPLRFRAQPHGFHSRQRLPPRPQLPAYSGMCMEPTVAWKGRQDGLGSRCPRGGVDKAPKKIKKRSPTLRARSQMWAPAREAGPGSQCTISRSLGRPRSHSTQRVRWRGLQIGQPRRQGPSSAGLA